MEEEEPAGKSISDHRWRAPVVCLVLAAITFAVFGQTVGFGFVNFDDNVYVYENAKVAGGLSMKGFAWAFTQVHSANWHPLTWLSHMLDCQLYGLNPGGHHFTNVLLHTATVIALFLVLRQMTGAFWRSAFVAAVFAIHPLRVESVAWIAERKDMLSGLFFMLTIGAYVRYARRPWSAARYGLVVLLFAMGLMSKPMLVTLPLVLLLLDYWPLQRVEPRKLSGLVLEKLPLLALSAASCVATFLAQNEAIRTAESFSAPLRFGNALVTCMIYLRQMVWPAGLAVFYPYPHNGLSAWDVVLAGMLVAGLSALALGRRRTQPWLLVGWLWYLLMLLPVVGVIQVGDQAHADRYTYLPQIGIYMALTWLAAEWGAKWQSGHVAFAGLATGVLAVFMVCAWRQTAYWKNSETLWTHALDCTTSNYIAHANLAEAFLHKGRLDEAITHYQETLQIKPGYAEAHYNLGIALFQKGRVDEAISHFQKAVELDPDYTQAHIYLGVGLARQGRMDEAITHFQKAVEIKPDNAEAHNNLGNALVQKGNVKEAILHYEQAQQLEPDEPSVQNNLAWLLATSAEASLRNGNKAVELAGQANAIARGQNPMFLRTLAAAFAEAGRFSDARESMQKAIELARAAGRQDMVEQLNSELKRYEAGLPIHQ